MIDLDARAGGSVNRPYQSRAKVSPNPITTKLSRVAFKRPQRLVSFGSRLTRLRHFLALEIHASMDIGFGEPPLPPTRQSLGQRRPPQ